MSNGLYFFQAKNEIVNKFNDQKSKETVARAKSDGADTISATVGVLSQGEKSQKPRTQLSEYAGVFLNGDSGRSVIATSSTGAKTIEPM